METMKLTMSGQTIENLLYSNQKPILELKISYPQIMGPLSKQGEYRFNDFYRTSALELNRRVRSELFRKAEEEARGAAEQEYDFTLHSFVKTFTVPRLDSKYTSVALDTYRFDGGAHGTTVRRGNTWDLTKGIQVPLSYFFRKNAPYRRVILNEISKQIVNQKDKGEIIFFENPIGNARKSFSERNYYLTHNSVTIFYPLYSLAPYYAGILTYKVPFSVLEDYWLPANKPVEVPPYNGNFSKVVAEFL